MDDMGQRLVEANRNQFWVAERNELKMQREFCGAVREEQQNLRS